MTLLNKLFELTTALEGIIIIGRQAF